jgi:hypothetical protein
LAARKRKDVNRAKRLSSQARQEEAIGIDASALQDKVARLMKHARRNVIKDSGYQRRPDLEAYVMRNQQMPARYFDPCRK